MSLLSGLLSKYLWLLTACIKLINLTLTCDRLDRYGAHPITAAYKHCLLQIGHRRLILDYFLYQLHKLLLYDGPNNSIANPLP